MQPEDRPKLLDADKMILDVLRSDGRITIQELAQRVSLPQTTTRDRVRRLEKLGIIQGYRAVIDPSKMGFTILAMVIVDAPEDGSTDVAERISSEPAVLAMHELLEQPGSFALKIAAKSTERMTTTLEAWKQNYHINVRSIYTLDPIQSTPINLQDYELERSVLGILKHGAR